MNYLVHPESLVFIAKSLDGFSVISEVVPQWTLLEIATDVADEWTDWWDDDQGFGSSDRTYMVKDFIDSVIDQSGLRGRYETKFTPRLSVVEYSEADHHERVFQQEIGG